MEGDGEREDEDEVTLGSMFDNANTLLTKRHISDMLTF